MQDEQPRTVIGTTLGHGAAVRLLGMSQTLELALVQDDRGLRGRELAQQS